MPQLDLATFPLQVTWFLGIFFFALSFLKMVSLPLITLNVRARKKRLKIQKRISKLFYLINKKLKKKNFIFFFKKKIFEISFFITFLSDYYTSNIKWKNYESSIINEVLFTPLNDTLLLKDFINNLTEYNNLVNISTKEYVKINLDFFLEDNNDIEVEILDLSEFLSTLVFINKIENTNNLKQNIIALQILILSLSNSLNEYFLESINDLKLLINYFLFKNLFNNIEDTDENFKIYNYNLNDE